jgi:tripartite-type tricarboxylate transporter receptor subunit TctC
VHTVPILVLMAWHGFGGWKRSLITKLDEPKETDLVNLPLRWQAAATALLTAALTAVTPAPALAQDAYPNKPIHLIVPFAAGGGGDTLARLVMMRVATELGQPLVVENVAGAGGNIGVLNGAKAAPDGYTLIYGTNGTHAINQTLYGKPGFNAERDFQPVSQLTRIAAMVVVRPGLPAGNMKELLALVKASPGKYTFASAGNGTTSHLAGEMLKARAGLDMVHVPYRGGALAMTDLLGGQVDLMIDVMPNTTPHVKGGRIKGLAVSTAQRLASLPEMPTIAESGVPDFDVSAWDAIFAPAGTPQAIVQRVNLAIGKALADPALQTQLRERGAEAAPSSPQALREFVSAEVKRWGEAVKRSGATVD